MQQRNSMTTLCFIEVGSGGKNPYPFSDQFIKDPPEIAPRYGIDPCCRFVEQDDLRPVNQGANKAELLLHPARELSSEPGAELAHSRGMQKLRGAFIALALARSKQVRVKPDVLIYRKVFVKTKPLRHVTEVMLCAFRVSSDVKPCDCRPACVGWHNSGEHSKCRGLARSIRPDESEDFARPNIEAEMINRGDSRKALRQAVSDDGGLERIRH